MLGKPNHLAHSLDPAMPKPLTWKSGGSTTVLTGSPFFNTLHFSFYFFILVSLVLWFLLHFKSLTSTSQTTPKINQFKKNHHFSILVKEWAVLQPKATYLLLESLYFLTHFPFRKINCISLPELILHKHTLSDQRKFDWFSIWK